MESVHFSMTWDNFAKNIFEIKTLSDEIFDDWTLHGFIENENGAYISKKLHTSFSDISISTEGVNLEESNEMTDEVENPIRENTTLTFDYHIVYNISYSCPVLCFNAWKGNGSFLTLEECWNVLHFTNLEYKFNVLSQMDHPVLKRPFFTLHPCKTAELIGSTFEASQNIVVSWLSTIGPAVGLNILNDYAKLTF